MPMITFKTRYLLGLVGGEISKEKVADEIYKLGFEVEQLDDNEMKVEITANRPDLLSAVGMARALRNFMHKSRSFKYELRGTKELEIAVNPNVSKERPFIAGLVAEGLELTDDSLEDIFNFSEKLCDTFGRMRRKAALGIYDLDKTSPPFSYALSDDGKFTPLKSSSPKSYSEVMRSNEKGLRYADAIRSKSMYPVLSDSNETMALIPIVNSEKSKVTVKTRNVFVEISGRSEDLVGKIADLFACLFIDMGAEVSAVKTTIGKASELFPKMEGRQILMAESRFESEIGVPIGPNNVLSLANKMGYEAAAIGNKIRFDVPVYRLDIINEQDILEDIAIGYGYDYIQPTPVPSVGSGMLEPSTALFERISEAMVGLGYSESMGSYLSNEETSFKMMRLKVPEARSYVSIKDAKTSSISMLRASLLPSLLLSLKASRHEKMPHRIFEVDMAFGMEEGPVEKYKLAAISVDPKSNFNYVKGVLESMLNAIGVWFSVSQGSCESFVPGRCAIIRIKGIEVGVFGELHPEVLANFGIEEPAVALEMDLSTL